MRKRVHEMTIWTTNLANGSAKLALTTRYGDALRDAAREGGA
jgi:hypothetical protein